MLKVLFFSLIMLTNVCAEFDGIDFAQRIITKHQRSKRFDTVCADYFSELGIKSRSRELSEKDEPEIFGGYLAITYYFNNNENQEAQEELRKLAEKPTQSKYAELLRRLNESSAQFGQYLPVPTKNFALSTIDMMSKTRDHYGAKFPFHKRGELSTESERKMEKILTVSELETGVEMAGHRIMSGSFGFSRRAATPEEKESMIGFLLDSVDRAIREGTDITNLLRNYDLKYVQGSSATPQVKRHIAMCRSILSSVHYILANQVDDFSEGMEHAIQRLVGEEWLSDASLIKEAIFAIPQVLDFINERLDGFIEKNVDLIPLSYRRALTESDYKLSAASQVSYNRYVQNPDTFDVDITKDAEFYTASYENEKRELVFNVINFFIATQTSSALNNLRIYAEIPSVFPFRFRSSQVTYYYNTIVELDNSDKDCSKYRQYSFTLDKRRIAEALLTKKRINTLLWLDQLISPQVLESSQYNLSKVRQKIKSFWQNLYETLVYAYVFAKEQKKEKAFFNNAFPTEKHCSDSLASMVQTWIKTETEALGKNSAKIANKKLSIQTKELIEADNVFIGAIVDNFILYWLAPKFIDWSRLKGEKEISLETIEANPKDILMLYPDVEDPKLAQEFAHDVAKRIENAAKVRAVEVFNAGKACQYYRSMGDDPLYSYSTTDGDLVVLFSLHPYASLGGSKIKLSDIKWGEVIKNKGSGGIIPFGRLLENRVLLEKYLQSEFLRYFTQLY